MTLRAFHSLFLIAAASLLVALIVWLPAAGALASGTMVAVWLAAAVSLLGVAAYAWGRHRSTPRSEVE